jgi:hypothetical protein
MQKSGKNENEKNVCNHMGEEVLQKPEKIPRPLYWSRLDLFKNGIRLVYSFFLFSLTLVNSNLKSHYVSIHKYIDISIYNGED